jgi:hypothetical protein
MRPIRTAAMVDSGRSGSQMGYLLIADLSGYTRFVVENDLDHAQGVLHDLISLIIEQLAAPLQFVELMGDAVFVYAPVAAVSDAERLLDMMEACYAGFRFRIEQMLRNTTCACSACQAIPQLDLKFVAHFGRFVCQATPKGEQLVGPDVVLLCRLLKNSVVASTGITAYALLTEPLLERVGRGLQPAAAGPAADLGLPQHVELVEAFGSVPLRVLDLAHCVERHRERFRDNLDALPVDLEIVTRLSGPASLAWGYITEPVLRPLWQRDVRAVNNQAASNGRTDIGWEGHCDHGGYAMRHRIVDWRPFDRITMHSSSSGRSISKPPPCQADFLFEPAADGGCVLRFQVRLRQPRWFIRLMFTLVKPIVRREWQGHFLRLQQLVAQEIASLSPAAAARLPVAPARSGTG